MRNFFIIFTSIIFVLTHAEAAPNKAKKVATKNPKNIILLISDGAGLSHVTFNIINSNGKSDFLKFSNIGLVSTASEDSAITDSAAAATAFATGKKTYNGAISLDKNKKSLTTIFEIAKKKGLATGLVVTCSVTHATPAAFVAHVKSRNMNEEIAKEYVTSHVDFFAGGGLKYFESSKRNDKQDLLSQLEKQGYKIYKNFADFFTDDYQGKVAALLADEHLPKVSEGRANYTVQALRKALKNLSQNKKGFILMVEGSQIDWGSHENDVEYIKQEMRDFDNAIGAAMDFANEDKNTLVIAVSDHETGGFALTGNKNINDNYGDIDPKFTSKGHSSTMIPLFAYGVGAKNFNGVYDNVEVFNKMRQSLGL